MDNLKKINKEIEVLNEEFLIKNKKFKEKEDYLYTILKEKIFIKSDNLEIGSNELFIKVNNSEDSGYFILDLKLKGLPLAKITIKFNKEEGVFCLEEKINIGNLSYDYKDKENRDKAIEKVNAFNMLVTAKERIEEIKDMPLLIEEIKLLKISKLKAENKLNSKLYDKEEIEIEIKTNGILKILKNPEKNCIKEFLNKKIEELDNSISKEIEFKLLKMYFSNKSIYFENIKVELKRNRGLFIKVNNKRTSKEDFVNIMSICVFTENKIIEGSNDFNFYKNIINQKKDEKIRLNIEDLYKELKVSIDIIDF